MMGIYQLVLFIKRGGRKQKEEKKTKNKNQVIRKKKKTQTTRNKEIDQKKEEHTKTTKLEADNIMPYRVTYFRQNVGHLVKPFRDESIDDKLELWR